MKTSALTSEKIENLPLILVVDKVGAIGAEIAKALSQDYVVVFVSKITIPENKNLIHIPFSKKIPQVPDNQYQKIFLVDDGHSVTRESVFSFISIARGSSAPLYFIASVRNVDVNHANEIVGEYAGVRVLVFGDLFDKNLFFDKNSSVNRYILEARKNKKILVAGNGLSLNLPITLDDNVKLIIKASYLDVAQKTLLLFPPDPVTDISLAHVFQKVNPDINVDFTKDVSERKIYIPQGAEHVIRSYDLEQKIRELDLEATENRELKMVDSGKKRTNFLKPLLLLLLIILFIVLLPFLTTGAYYAFGKFELNSAKNSALSGNFEKAIKETNNAKTLFATSGKTSNFLESEAGYLGLSHEAQRLQQKSEVGEDTSDMLASFLVGAQTLKQIFQGKSVDPENDFQDASNWLKSGLAIEEKIKAEGNLPKEYDQDLSSFRPIIDLFSNASDVLPDALGFKSQKKYLVLLQNNNSIRPGGGIISSYGILTIRNGRAISFTSSDSASLDVSFKDHVEPPFYIRRYMGANNLYLVDSGFDPDFVKSAISASGIYSLETKNKVDGVIGVNLNTAKNLLSVLGLVTLPDGEIVNDSNVLEKAKDSDDKNFLGNLSQSLLRQLGFKKELSYTLLLNVIGQSMKEKDLLFAFSDQGTQDIFSANGWSGTLLDQRSVKEGSINDYVGISESSLLKNQANYFISRSMSKKTVIDTNGQVSSRLQIAYKNSSSKDEYKNYVQLILPQNVSINSIMIDNQEVEVDKAVTDLFVYESKGFKLPKGLEVDQETEGGKSVLGFLITVPAGKLKTIGIDYNLDDKVSKSLDLANYSLKLYKQPGIAPYPFDLSFDLPDNYTTVSGENPLSTQVDSDKEFDYKFLQK